MQMNVKADKMRYQPNKSGYSFILLGLAISIAALFSIITPTTVVPNFGTAVEILLNIVLMLVTFLAAERCKVYSRDWALITLVIAGIHILRIFLVPTQLVAKGQLSGWQFTGIVFMLVSTAVCLVLGALITLRKQGLLHKHLREIGE
jgi:hypothetical protein